jgi:hypothetical protein
MIRAIRERKPEIRPSLTCIFIYIYIYIYVCVLIYVYICMCIYVCTYMYIYMYAYVPSFRASAPLVPPNASVRFESENKPNPVPPARRWACIYWYLDIYVYIYIDIYIHTYIYKEARRCLSFIHTYDYVYFYIYTYTYTQIYRYRLVPMSIYLFEGYEKIVASSFW